MGSWNTFYQSPAGGNLCPLHVRDPGQAADRALLHRALQRDGEDDGAGGRHHGRHREHSSQRTFGEVFKAFSFKTLKYGPSPLLHTPKVRFYSSYREQHAARPGGGQTAQHVHHRQGDPARRSVFPQQLQEQIVQRLRPVVPRQRHCLHL